MGWSSYYESIIEKQGVVARGYLREASTMLTLSRELEAAERVRQMEGHVNRVLELANAKLGELRSRGLDAVEMVRTYESLRASHEALRLDNERLRRKTGELQDEIDAIDSSLHSLRAAAEHEGRRAEYEARARNARLRAQLEAFSRENTLLRRLVARLEAERIHSVTRP